MQFAQTHLDFHIHSELSVYSLVDQVPNKLKQNTKDTHNNVNNKQYETKHRM